MISGHKILYIITQSKFGGAQKYVLELATAFAAHNSVSIAVGELQDQDQKFFQPLSEHSEIQVHRLTHLQRGINPIANLRSVWELMKLYRQLQPDIIHINSSMAGFTASLAAHWYNRTAAKKIAVVYTAHGFVFDEPLPAVVRQLYIWIERLGARWKDRIITVSDQSKVSGIRRHIAPLESFITIHNGLSLAKETFLTREQARQELGLSLEATIVGSIASHYPTKGLTYLIEAATRADNQQLQFAVIGDGPQKARLQFLIDSHKLTERFHLLGEKPQAWKYLKAFDLFVLPSVKEGHPYALLEAGLATLPVIATRVGGIPEIIEDGVTGWLVPLANSQALATALQAVISDPLQSDKRAKALEQFVSQEFSTQQMIDKTSQDYQALLT